MIKVIEGAVAAKGKRFGILTSRFNDSIGSKLVEGAIDALRRTGADAKDIEIIKVPGAFDIPLAARKIARSGRYSAIICTAVLIRGATPHFDYIGAEVTKGIASVALKTGVPIEFGVVTADTIEQAIERAGAKSGNRGWDAAVSAVEMVNLFERLEGERALLKDTGQSTMPQGLSTAASE